MTKKNKITVVTSAALATAALTGLFSGIAQAEYSSTQTISAGNSVVELVAGTLATANGAVFEKDGHSDCKGKNECKGKGGCKSSDNGCKGKNSCKGKGGCNGHPDDK
jgi:hypothetical protein